MKLKSIFLLFFFCILQNMPLYAEYFKHIGLEEGFSSPSVMAIYQDCLGRMWFGTREGINLYDGNQVTSFKGWIDTVQNNGQPFWIGNEVSSIVGDWNGDVYLFIDNRLIKYSIRQEHFQYLTDEDQASALTSFNGDIWYIKQDSLFRLNHNNETAEFVLKPQATSTINCLTVQQHFIYIGTANGAIMIDRETHKQQQILKGIDIYSFFESSQKELWIGTRMEGLYKMSSNRHLEKIPYQPGSTKGVSSEQIRNFIEDDEGNIWFGTFDGLHKYDAATKEYKLIQIPQYMGGLTHPSIFSLYKDRQGTIWVGSYFGGVNYFNPQHTDFTHYNYKENTPTKLNYSYNGEITSDNNGNLWIGTDGGGVYCVDKRWSILKQFTAKGPNSLPHNNIKSICYDPLRNSLYIGTYLGGLSRYDISSGHFHNYLQDKKYKTAPNDIIYHTKIHDNRLYISARNGVFYLDIPTQQFHKLPIPVTYYEHFDIDQEGNMYLVTRNSLFITHINRPDDFIRLPLIIGDHHLVTTKVASTSQGAYIATLGGGILFYDRQTKRINHYTVQNSLLPSDFCYNICQTHNGKILITNRKGITCFFPEEKKFTTLNFMGNFPSAHIINGCGIYTTTDGTIYIGDTEGITSFHEDEFDKPNAYNPYTNFYFSELWVNNQHIQPNDGTGILEESLPYTTHLKLNHLQNNLTIRFTISNYEELLTEKWFMYKLEGLDRQWVKTKQTELYYTNLNPGKYTLHVCAVDDSDGQKISDELTLQIYIAAPWYNTWWAWSIYLISLIAGALYFISNRITKRTLAFSLEKERFEKQQAEQLNHEKLVFFTNVSHEFRTPLTLISSHIDMLLQKSLPPTIYNPLLKIKKNASHLNNLISELLEFRKLDQNHEILYLKHQDIVAFLKEIYLSFADYAHQREICYSFNFPETPVLCWFDPRLMEKVFFNLLSNAFKYTPDKGTITLSGEVSDEKILVRVADNGIGISQQESKQIFTRFYQGNAAKENKDIFKGTGIGLALTKNIIEKHHGNITFTSTLGKGSTFTVSLSLSEQPFQQDPHIQLLTEKEEPTIVSDSLPTDYLENSDTPLAENIEDNRNQTHTVLLVEDNEELLQILKDLFSPFYKVICAHNGKEGLACVHNEQPDLIISDIMMPEMSGTEMCLQLKNNIELCHIPIILLTALNSPEQNIEGLNRGADDYITKPFHVQLLLARANNLIRNRLLVQRQFTQKPISDIDLTSINPLDKDLLKRTTEIIEKHMDDVDFDIPQLCKEIGMGRSLLYTKFKALTGMTPNNFILNQRLKHAASLLQQHPNLSIAEISDLCGFNTPVYFSRCFKNLYECSPKEYQKQKASKTSN